LNRFTDHYSDRENEATIQVATDEAIRQDARIAAMPREKVFEIMRSLIQKRFDPFERTGDATGITTVGIKRPTPEPPADGAAE
jgi:hypothetical protein